MPPVCFDHPSSTPRYPHIQNLVGSNLLFFPILHCYHFSHNDRWRFLISTSGRFWSSSSSNLSILLHLFFALTTLVLSLWRITLTQYSQNGWSQYCATSQPTFYRSSKINPIKQLAPCFALWDRTSIKNPLYLMRNTSDPGAEHVQRSSLVKKKFRNQLFKNSNELTIATWLYLPPGPPRSPIPGTKRLADLKNKIWFPFLKIVTISPCAPSPLPGRSSQEER